LNADQPDEDPWLLLLELVQSQYQTYPVKSDQSFDFCGCGVCATTVLLLPGGGGSKRPPCPELCVDEDGLELTGLVV
jgi:hypothetical protein